MTPSVPWRPDDNARDGRDNKNPDNRWAPHPQGKKR